eukprot:NODE_57_length_25931_cov_0.351037.p5 type:complete len:514 gc:universal NODE_57_length_25931_cov_0.351037:15758-17299(+)
MTSTLREIIDSNDSEMLEKYLQKHPDQINMCVASSKSYPAHLVVKKKSVDMVKVLIKLGAQWDLEELKLPNHIPLFYCIELDSYEILFEIAANHKKLLNCVDSEGFTVIHQMVIKGRSDRLEELALRYNNLPLFAKLLNQADYDNVNPLILSTMYGHSSFANAILKIGKGLVSVNEQISNTVKIKSTSYPKGFTALHIAAAIGDLDLVSLLIRYNAVEIENVPMCLGKPSSVIGILKTTNLRQEKNIRRALKNKGLINSIPANSTSDFGKVVILPETETKVGTLQKRSRSKSPTTPPFKRKLLEKVKGKVAVGKKLLPVTLRPSATDRVINTLQTLPNNMNDDDLQDLIFSGPVNKTARNTRPLLFKIENSKPVTNSIVAGKLFTQLKIHLSRMSNVKITDGFEKFTALVLIIRSLLTESKETAVQNIWILHTDDAKKYQVKRKENTIVVKTNIKVDEDDHLNGSKEIGFICPLSALFVLSSLMKDKLIDSFRDMLSRLFEDQLRTSNDYKMF